MASNKSDLFETEQVKDSEGKKYAKKHNAKFKLISAKANKQGKDTLFELLIKRYINIQNGIDVDPNEEKGQNSITLKKITNEKKLKRNVAN